MCAEEIIREARAKEGARGTKPSTLYSGWEGSGLRGRGVRGRGAARGGGGGAWEGRGRDPWQQFRAASDHQNPELQKSQRWVRLGSGSPRFS